MKLNSSALRACVPALAFLATMIWADASAGPPPAHPPAEEPAAVPVSPGAPATPAATPAAAPAPRDLVIAKLGRTDYQIVLPSVCASKQIGDGLAEVARLMQAAFAANRIEIPVVSEDARDPQKPGIYLGATEFAKASGVDLAALKGYDYALNAVGKDIIIAGNDQPSRIGEESNEVGQLNMDRIATGKAVADFLREYANVRFLYPDFGDGVAESAKIDLAKSPGIEFLPAPTIAVPSGLDVVWRAKLEYSIPRNRNSVWHLAQNKFPTFNEWWGGHTHQQAVPPEKYFDTHPEYFALFDGKRYRGEQYCISNPGFQELLYQFFAGAFDRGFDRVYIGHSDGFMPCQCEECLKLYGTGNDWTEKMWIFNRNLAQRLYESHPDKTVVLTAYTVTELAAPKSFNKLPPNTMVMVCGTNEEDLAMWKGLEVPKGFISYIYTWTPNFISRYAPASTPASIEKQMRRLFRNNMRGIYNDGAGPILYGLEGPSSYVFGRIWDDPENLSGDTLSKEFIEAAFGKAAPTMAVFYEKLHQSIAPYTDYLATRLSGWQQVRDGFRMLSFLFPPPLIEQLDEQLKKAEGEADNDRVRARLALVRREFEWLRSTMNVLYLYQAHSVARDDKALRDRLLEAIDARNEMLAGFFNEDRHNSAKKPHPAWNKVLFPIPGHDFNHIKLVYPRYQENLDTSALNWDTAAMRAAPAADAARLAATRVAAPVTIDSPLWEQAAPATLRLAPPSTGEGVQTTLRTLYGKDAFYARFECEIPPALLEAAAKAGGGNLADQEAVDVILAPQPGKDISFRFKVGPSGARYEGATGFITDTMNLLHGKEDPEWNGQWESNVRLEPTNGRWIAMLKIPYSTLKADPPTPGSTYWKANFGRSHPVAPGKIEQLLWSGTARIDDPAAMGAVDFVEVSQKEKLRALRSEGGFDNPNPEWAKLPNPLPAKAWGPWRLKTDPLDQGLRDKWSAPEFDDSAWAEVRVPSWFGEVGIEALNGCSWYRVPFEVPAEWKGKSLRILFQGVDEEAWVYLNGRLLREHSVESEKRSISDLCEHPFAADAPPDSVVFGGKNVLAVRVRNGLGEAGIWKPVFIHAIP